MAEAAPSSSNGSSTAELKTILTRPAPLDLSSADLNTILPALTSEGDKPALALAVLSRSLAPSPTSTTRTSVQSALESLLAGTDSSDLIQGLSTLSATLQVAPTFAASLLKEGALRSQLEEAVAHISKPVGKGKAKQDEETLALVELLSLAAGQPTMRGLVRHSAGGWLESLLGEPKQKKERQRGTRLKAMAAVGVVKLSLGKDEAETTGLPAQEKESPTKWSLEDLTELLVDLAVSTTNLDTSSDKTPPSTADGVLLPCLEGLAYLTLTSSASIKKTATKSSFLSLLFSFAPKQPAAPNSSSSARDYALATLLDHLTAYPPPQDAESDAAQINRLKRFASAGSSQGNVGAAPVVESAESVTARISLIVKHDPSPIPTIRQLCLSPSLQTRRLAGTILHSLVTPQPLRGQLLQAGVARLFLSLIRQLPSPFSPSEDVPTVQGLAKLLITANPLLIFGPTPSSPILLEATTALTLPLGASPSDAVGLLPKFETLMALTNIASLDPELTDKMARLTLRDRPIPLLTAVEELQLSSNTMVRRAATELMCNLVASEPGIEYFEPPRPAASSSSSSSSDHAPSSHRLHLVLALSSSPDLPTRLAASGALTSLVWSPLIATALAATPKWLDMLLALLEDDDAGVRHRVYEVFRAMGETIKQQVQLEVPPREGDEAAAAERRRQHAREGLRDKQVVDALKDAYERETVLELREAVKDAVASVADAL
ncbi:hypothetical protein JCM5296_004655 [Sporobolomyces johnsonii]